jgi:DeoR/GlpR family transcriptional regulator of sugar metabolism
MRAARKRLSRGERFERIVAELRARPSVRISHLASQFGVSSETVRRDIDELTRRGLVDRTYGGAAAHALMREPSIDDRFRLHVAVRGRIGAHAAALVAPGETVMIDSGSTTMHFAKRLAAVAEEVTVITNSLAVAIALGTAPAVRVLLCPGNYDAREGGTFGAETCAFLQRFSAAKAVIGASGLTAEGPVEARTDASWVKRVMLERSARGLLLVDHTKFDRPSLEVVCPLDGLDDVVTDAPPPATLGRALRRAGTTVHVAAEDEGAATGVASGAKA